MTELFQRLHIVHRMVNVALILSISLCSSSSVCLFACMYVCVHARVAADCRSWSIKWVYNAASALSRNQPVVRRPIDHTNPQFNEPMCIQSFNRSTGLHFGVAKQEDGSHESFNASLRIRSIIPASLQSECGARRLGKTDGTDIRDVCFDNSCRVC